MKSIKILATAVMLLGSCCFGQTKASSVGDQGYSITVTPPADPIRLGLPIDVTITVKNTSDRETYWEAEFPDTAYRAFNFTLTKNGSEVATTFFHRKIKGKQRPDDPQEVQNGGSILSPVAPGGSFSFTVDLKRIYEITEPGNYTLDVSRKLSDNETAIRAKTLTLKIVP